MATIFNPITLPASKMLNTMTSVITDIRLSDTIGVSDIVNDLVSSCRIGKVDFGKGIIYTFKVGLQPTKKLTETSSAFTITKPAVGQETITIDQYNFVPISVSEILTHDAVTDGSLLNSFLEFVSSLAEDTIQFNLFSECNYMYQNWTPKQPTQTITINQIDTTGMTGTDLQSTLQYNATEIAKVMRKTVNNMKVINNKYTDIAKYIDPNTGVETDVLSALRGDDLKFVVNDMYWTNFLADSMASLYHSEKVGEMIPGERFVLLPEDVMKDTKTIGWLSHRDKFALADYYRTTLSIQDPSTLYNNAFYHYAYGADVFEYAPGVKFVANIVSPTPKVATRSN